MTGILAYENSVGRQARHRGGGIYGISLSVKYIANIERILYNNLGLN